MARLTMLKPRLQALDLSTAKIPPKTAEPFYQSAAWKGLVKDLIAQRGRRCEKCGSASGRIFADHIVELKDGGEALDPRNLQLLCSHHHAKKTADERAKRLAQPASAG